MAEMRTPTALTIAGSDSGGGAGIQADLKTFQRFQVFGMTAVTLITVQNTEEVARVELLDPELVTEQIAAVAEDIGVGAAKTGALGAANIIVAVAEAVVHHEIAPLVVDPVMISKHGHPLLVKHAIETLTTRLFPLATLITPNLDEAAALLGRPISNEEAMSEAAQELTRYGCRAVLIKGGHLGGETAVDVLYESHPGGGRLSRFETPRVATRHTHGTGCTYSAAITALLARGVKLRDAVAEAKRYIHAAIASAPGLGGGYGPVNHLAE